MTTRQNTDYGYDIQKVYLEMFMTDAGPSRLKTTPHPAPHQSTGTHRPGTPGAARAQRQPQEPGAHRTATHTGGPKPHRTSAVDIEMLQSEKTRALQGRREADRFDWN